MSALVRLREVVKGQGTSWHVEVWQDARLAAPSIHPERRAARSIAQGLADKLGAVVILVGPDRIPAPIVRQPERVAS